MGAEARPAGATRCRLVVAGPGYGKSTALAEATANFAGGVATYLSARQAPARLALSGPAGPAGKTSAALIPGMVAVDDVCHLSAAGQARLVRTLAALPDTVEVLLAAGRPLGTAAMAALPWPVRRWGPGDLALSADAVVGVLCSDHGIDDADAARQVFEFTAGWPMLVHLAAEAIVSQGAEVDELPAALVEPGTPGAAWLRDRVLAGLPQPVRRVLRLLTGLDPVSASLAVALTRSVPGGGTGARAGDAVDFLAALGVLVPDPRWDRPKEDRPLRIVPMIQAYLARQPATRPAARVPGGGAERARLGVAATWYATEGYPFAAARAFLSRGEPDRAAHLLAAHGEEILAAGQAADLADVLDALAPNHEDPGLRLLRGDAARMSGRVADATQAFAPLIEAADRCGRWTAALAWRAAMVHYMRADYQTAVDVLGRAASESATGTPDEGMLWVCRASALRMLGRLPEAGEAASWALSAASAAADDRVLASAHIAAALVTRGEQEYAHLAQALAAAQRAGDLVRQVHALNNTSDVLLRDGRYAPALDAAEAALRLAEVGSPPGLLVSALHNAGEAALRLGRYPEATARFERCLAICHRVGLRRAAAARYGLAEVHRHLGHRQRSRAAYEQAADLARETVEVQVLVPALAGLARLLASGTDPDRVAARAAADEAQRLAPTAFAAAAATAQGWVALAEADRELARSRAATAVAAARDSRQAVSLAEALELMAAASGSTSVARSALREALSIWAQTGSAPLADRVQLLLGRLPCAEPHDRLAARSAAARLRRHGVPAADGSDPTGDGPATGVAIRVLGRFEASVGGVPVELPAWRSRQARVLVKMLVASRGRPVAREALAELLWPDHGPRRTAHRLSVLLSVVRGVLDPSRLWPADHYLRADTAGLALDTTRVRVDVEDLLRDAAHGLALARTGDTEPAREVLTGVVAGYRGDAFEDEPYADWAAGLRAEVRTVWLRSLRELAALHRTAGEPEQAVSCLFRLLADDRFDEPAYRELVVTLVHAGRHGEARRVFARWSGAMRAIDAPAPQPALLRARAARSDRRRIVTPR